MSIVPLGGSNWSRGRKSKRAKTVPGQPVRIFYKRKNIHRARCLGVQQLLTGELKRWSARLRALYYKEYYHAQPLIFKCEWESIEQKKERNVRKEKQKKNKKFNEKKESGKRKCKTRASRLWVQLCTYCTKSLIITTLKIRQSCFSLCIILCRAPALSWTSNDAGRVFFLLQGSERTYMPGFANLSR